MCTTVHTEHMYKVVVLSLLLGREVWSFVKLHSPAEVSNDEPMDIDMVICLSVCWSL